MRKSFVPFFKDPKPSARVQRALRRIDRDDRENLEKAKVRRRDKGCRWPLCGCRKLRLALEVSHNEHKGAGGNPDGSRSQAPLMLQMCRERHRTNPFSIHNKTIDWEPLDTKLGANGPIRFLVDLAELGYRLHESRRPRVRPHLHEVAREASVGVLEPLDDENRAILTMLARMVL